MRTVYSAIFHNLFIKITALALALLTWSYIASQLYRQLPEAQKSSSTVIKIEDMNVIVKNLPVHVNLVGTPDRRYKVAIDKIRVIPPECVITGSLEKIENLSFITTEPISVNGLTKSLKQKIKLKVPPGCSIYKGQQFFVAIPIVRIRLR